ncbi:MAG: drug/metabolite transporter (DMT)-like permease [Cellvibrionaceae bacterium]|jgi:drug/metabolite transporter (DMT)-like permease
MVSVGIITNIKSHLYVLLATLLVAGSFLASEKLSSLINPISLTLLRFVCSVVLLLPFVLIKNEWLHKVLIMLPRAAIMSFFYSLFFICFFESLKTTTSLNTGTLYTLVPFFTALISFFILGTAVSPAKLLIYFLGVIGTCWVIFNGEIDLFLAFSLSKGDFIFIIGALSMCSFSVSMKLLYRNDDMIVLVFCTLVCGAIWMLLALLIFGQPFAWHLVKGPAVFNMVYLVLGATIATSYLFQSATVTLGPSKVMAYTYLNPAVVVLLLLLIDGVAINFIILPGILLSTLATIFLQLDSTKSKAPS